MKFKTIILFIALSLFVVQPANVLKAVSVSDVLGKAQELAGKQKIKGKKLEKFILNNVITIDYEGKKQSYKFNKDTTYEVYEGKKVVGARFLMAYHDELEKPKALEQKKKAEEEKSKEEEENREEESF